MYFHVMEMLFVERHTLRTAAPEFWGRNVNECFISFCYERPLVGVIEEIKEKTSGGREKIIS